jgi:dienelactone hydrolase
LEIEVDGQKLAGTLAMPITKIPGVLFVHGWGGSQERDLDRARDIAALGCVCLTFDLRGHAGTSSQYDAVTREDNLRDLLAAYDRLVGQPTVDRTSIAVVGSSYGGYLAAILSGMRKVRWLAMRVPALYKDEEWSVPKRKLDRDMLAAYRASPLTPQDNKALRACLGFTGDVLIVESEKDDLVPHETINSYRGAFRQAHSLTYRVIDGGDHALTSQLSQKAYTSLLVSWLTEMVLGSRRENPVLPL